MYHVNPVPEISQLLDPIFNTVATPFAVNVLVPVDPVGDQRIVSVSIAIDISPAACSFTNVTAVPKLHGILEFEGIVNVREVASELGCKICLPASVITKVYDVDCEFCGTIRTSPIVSLNEVNEP